MAAPLIDLILSTEFITSENRTPAVGLNTAAFLSGDADSGLDGKLYVDAAEVTADVTATDLTAQAGNQIKGLLAQGSRVGGVRLLVYDAGGGDTPDDALTAGVTSGYLPGWDYCLIDVQGRTDAAIAAAATWVDANARGRALVFGQLSTSSILSGTIPATTAASPGADLACILYDDVSTSTAIERAVGYILSVDMASSRPGFGIQRPIGLSPYTTELTKPQQTLASGRESGQARCWIHGPLYPADSRRVIVQGYTIGGTLAEVEWGVIVLQMRSRAAVAQLVATRSELKLPIRTTPGDAAAIKASIDQVFAQGLSAGYLVPAVADPTTGQPDLPNGYTLSVTFSGTTAVVTGWAAYPGDVRRIDFTMTGIVS